MRDFMRTTRQCMRLLYTTTTTSTIATTSSTSASSANTAATLRVVVELGLDLIQAWAYAFRVRAICTVYMSYMVYIYPPIYEYIHIGVYTS
jgi:hypothetical protein